MATVPAEDALVVGITKHLVETTGGPRPVMVSIAVNVVEYLEQPNVRDLLTRFVAELHAAGIDTEARPEAEAG